MMMKKRLTFSAVAALLLFCSCQENIDERIAREAEEYTRRNCPNSMENIVLDSMVYKPATRTIIYYNTLGENIDNDYVRSQSEEMKEAVRKSVKEDLTIKYYKENEIKFRYVYRSHDGKDTVLNILVTPKDYK
jgi:PBP1b-binding outer membrane lipoprotein LpoB